MSQYGRPRLPFAPLMAASQADSLKHLARLLGIDAAAVGRCQHKGLTWSCADAWSVRLGFHPADLWGDDWWAVGAGDVCPNGHDYTDDNTLWEANGCRRCRTCHNSQHARKQRAVADRRRRQRLIEQDEAAA